MSANAAKIMKRGGGPSRLSIVRFSGRRRTSDERDSRQDCIAEKRPKDATFLFPHLPVRNPRLLVSESKPPAFGGLTVSCRS